MVEARERYEEVDPTTPVTTQTFPCPNITLHAVSMTDIITLSDKIQDHWGKTGQLPNRGEMIEILQACGVEWEMRNLSVHPNDPEYAFWQETMVEVLTHPIVKEQARHEVDLQDTP